MRKLFEFSTISKFKTIRNNNFRGGGEKQRSECPHFSSIIFCPGPLECKNHGGDKHTVFPCILSAESILFLNLEIVENSNSCRKIQVFTYLMNWIFAAETIQGRKLFKSGNYLRKNGTWNKAIRLFLAWVVLLIDLKFHFNCIPKN